MLSLGALLLCLQSTKTVRQAALLGWIFGTTWLCMVFWWLFTSMHVYGGLAAPLAAMAVFLLAAMLSIYLAAGTAAWRMWHPGGTVHRALLIASLWMLVELARGQCFTGFPWGASGYAHVDGPLAPLAPWLGVYGVGAVSCFICALCAEVAVFHKGDRGVQAGSRRSGLLALSFLLLPLVVLQWMRPTFSQPAGWLNVALLQGNIAQDQKFEPGSGLPFALAWYRDQIVASRAELTLAPETAVPVLQRQLPPGYWPTLTSKFFQGDQALILGMPAGDERQGYTNTALGLSAAHLQSYRYDKHHLVPFGEFVPPGFRWFTEMMKIPLGDFARGSLSQPSFDWRGQRIAPNICYEDLFGEELAARFASPNRGPTLFANLSNIAWFGDGIAIDQHLGISRMRAIEFERPFVRATNTGATVIIDHQGRVTHALARATRGVLTGSVQGREGLTPYALWAGTWGLWPMWLAGLASVAVFALRAQRAARSNLGVQT